MNESAPQRRTDDSPAEERLAALLLEWEDGRDAGHEPTAAELCRDCPELANELQRRIAALKSLSWLTDPTDPPTWRPPADGVSTSKLVGRAAGAALVLGQRLGNYEIVARLGSGGMGEVYKARHCRMRRTVALKLLPPALASQPEAIARFQRECQALASLAHPNVVVAYDADEADGIHFLVMEHIAGENLADVVKNNGPLRVALAVDCAVQAARGLAYAHARGVIHRDIKPSNLLRDGSGVVKVLDLGLARLELLPDNLEETLTYLSNSGDGLTGEGSAFGTVGYMSPEQTFDARRADERSDVYSLGCTLFYLLTGRAPYEGKTPLATMLMHRNAEVVPSARDLNAAVPPRLDAILAKMLAKSPDARQQSMDQVIAALSRFQRETARRKRTLVAAAAALLIVLGAVIVIKYRDGSQQVIAIGDRKIESLEFRPDDQAPPMRTDAKKGDARLLQDRAETPEADERFTPLLNGGDLAGWTLTKPDAARCEIEGGVLQVENTAGNLYLFTDRTDYTDFELRCEFRCASAAEGASVMLRTDPSPLIWGGMRGYLVSVGRAAEAAPGVGAAATALALASCERRPFELERVTHGAPAPDQWHKLACLAIGNRIRVTLDGDLLIDHHDEGKTFRRGAVALQCPAKSRARYRKIELRELAPAADADPHLLPRRRWVLWGLGNPWNDEWSVFQHVEGRKWIESGTMTPRFDRHEFTEVARTESYVDLQRPDGAGKLVVRMHHDHGEIGPDFDHLRPWRLAANWPDATPPVGPLHGPGVELLPLIEAERDTVQGTWQRLEGRLLCRASPQAQIEVPFAPPDEYELTLYVQPHGAGDPFFVGMPVAGSQTLLTLNGDAGQTSSLSLAAGQPSSDSPSRSGIFLHPLQANKIVCRVGRTGIQVLCNGILVLDWEGAPERLSLPPGWKASAPPRFFLGGRNAWVQVARMHVAPLSGDDSPSEAPPPGGGHVDLIERIEPARDAVRGKWTLEQGTLSATSGMRNCLQLPVAVPRNYRLTAVFARQPRSAGPAAWVALGLTVDKFQTMAVLSQHPERRYAGLHLLDGKGPDDNGTRVSIPPLADGTPCTVVCTVGGNHLRLEVDGIPALDWQGDPRRLSLEQHWAVPDPRRLFVGADCAVRFRKLEFETLEEEEQ